MVVVEGSVVVLEELAEDDVSEPVLLEDINAVESSMVVLVEAWVRVLEELVEDVSETILLEEMVVVVGSAVVLE
ncbi:hypothetical protein UVI_02043680 [Ustilaginoidea virens]|uniref:Uncharacterized protein n=1 Tax=Ustilaginoidea virens TaxID=1159556 RepID=A0A1B5L6W4_USTVR|nr:hypothetical protein UVI_02043680 [Ustilaginoidea virens]